MLLRALLLPQQCSGMCRLEPTYYTSLHLVMIIGLSMLGPDGVTRPGTAAAATVLGACASPRPTYYNNSLQLVVVIGLSMLGPDSPDYHMLLRVLLLPQQCSGHV